VAIQPDELDCFVAARLAMTGFEMNIERHGLGKGLKSWTAEGLDSDGGGRMSDDRSRTAGGVGSVN
jgi:hypothetical protein